MVMQKQVHVYYCGMVQGVGFRYAVQNIAKDLGVSGWVSNLSDGRVELLAEGEEGALEGFLSRINRCFSGQISSFDSRWNQPGAKFSGFSIKF